MEEGTEEKGKEMLHEAQAIMQGLTGRSCYIEPDSAPRIPEGGLCFRWTATNNWVDQQEL